jgi:UDP-N-acetyl-D-glucosamine dehydrogenase
VKGSKILVLGVSYKRDTADLRESPALDIMRLLEQRGAKVSYHDPYNDEVRMDGGHVYRNTRLTPANLARADLVLIVTDHSEFDYDKVVRHATLVLDTRNATREVKVNRSKVHKL